MMFVRLSIPTAVFGAVLFLFAGRVDLWAFWAYLGLLLGSFSATFTALARWSPGLLAERIKPPSDRDRATQRLVALPFFAHLALAGLDARFGWTVVPLPVQVLGFVAVASGFGLVAWTLLTNPFASSAVRLQPDREQRVITTGPYALVRHPMYLAVVFVSLGAGVALGSWLSGLPLLLVIAVFVRRTLLEDALLRAELRGYADYAARVRWRVIPHLF
ncbi:MAG: isoprenylcysteine carboxylmethyltransferase family protein [Archangium sp.]|nr:isoprenylcysteine carboxylmethyltransferase family protein [Archangium sp.]